MSCLLRDDGRFFLSPITYLRRKKGHSMYLSIFSLIVLAVLFESLPQKATVSSVVVDYVQSLVVEISIDIVLVYLLVNAIQKERYVQLLGFTMFLAEHIRQYAKCYRTQTTERHVVILLMESIVLYDAFSNGDTSAAVFVGVGFLMHAISMLYGGKSFLPPSCVRP